MADCPQHTLQIMETQTRFDLDAAIAKWQQELAAQADLTPIVRRELETHLRDTVRELQGRGLNNEESFWLARRRVGRPQQLNEEFAKADPNNLWRDRAFWMAVVLLGMHLWSTLCHPLGVYRISSESRLQNVMPDWLLVHSPFWLRVLPLLPLLEGVILVMGFIPLVVLAFFKSNKRLNFAKTALSFVTASRARFVVAALLLFFIANSPNFHGASISRLLFTQFLWDGPLMFLGAYLMRPNKQVASQAA
jgi:hypothetical protein